MERKQKAVVYIVINEGEILYASKDEDNADNYAEEKQNEIEEEIAKDMNIDEDEDFSKVVYEAGAEYGTFKVVEIDLNRYNEDETIRIFIENHGEEFIEYSEIIDKLRENGEDEYDDDDDDDEEDDD